MLAWTVFFLVVVLVWVACYAAKDPPGMAPASRFAEVSGRLVAATLLTVVLAPLPALIAFALVGGTLA